MRDSGQDYRSEGHSDWATCTQGTSSASEYAARHRAPERIMSSQPAEDLRPTYEQTRRPHSMERSAQTSFSPATDYTLNSVPRSPTGPPRARYASGHAAGAHGNQSRELSSDGASDTDSSFSSGSYHDWSEDNMDIDQESVNPSSCARGAAAPSQFEVELNTADRATASAQPMPTALRSYSNVVHGYSGTRTSPPPGAFSTRSQHDICVVCKVNRVYELPSGVKPYPTCGLKCAAKCKEERNAQTLPYHSSSLRLPKCVVCGIKDQYYNSMTGRRYPTCGLTCASTQKAAAAIIGNCDFCHKRPKAISKTTGKPYEFCGRGCREKSKALLEEAMEGTCKTCLICLRLTVVDLRKHSEPYCGQECLLAAEHQSPTMIEIPRGHVLFDKYKRRFQDGWYTSSDDKITFKRIYFLAQSSAVRDRYAKYKEDLKRSHRNKPAMEKELWISVIRECDTGDSGEVDFCPSPTCPFCSIIRDGFQPQKYPTGVTLASSSASANDFMSGAALTRSTKILMNVRLAYAPGKLTPEVTARDINEHWEEMRKSHSVVKIGATKGSRMVETGQMHVFELPAIFPLGCVVYA